MKPYSRKHTLPWIPKWLHHWKPQTAPGTESNSSGYIPAGDWASHNGFNFKSYRFMTVLECFVKHPNNASSVASSFPTCIRFQSCIQTSHSLSSGSAMHMTGIDGKLGWRRSMRVVCWTSPLSLFPSHTYFVSSSPNLSLKPRRAGGPAGMQPRPCLLPLKPPP